MNKYQEALDRLSSIDLDFVLDKLGYEGAEKVSFYGINDYPNLEKQGDIDLLQEIIDIATPKFVKCPKGFQGYSRTRYICPNCNKQVRNDEKYCHKCGQNIKFPKVKVNDNGSYLDWSEDENS